MTVYFLHLIYTPGMSLRSGYGSLCFFLVFVACFLSGINALGQSSQPLYSTGFGLRLGNAPGVSLKKMLNERHALEAQLEIFRHRAYDGFLVTALYEYHTLAFQVPRLNWYFGAGVHAGAYMLRTDEEIINETETDDNGPLYGLDAIIGLEYKFPEVPFSISADVKPSLTLPTNRASALNGALTLRWVW